MKTNQTWMLVTLALATSGLGCAVEAENDTALGTEATGETSEAVTVAPSWSVTSAAYDLPYHGGTGGTAARKACYAGDVAVGFYGSYGNFMNELGLICAHLNSNGTLGAPYTTGTRGTPGPTSFSFRCPLKTFGFSEDQMLVGLRGRSGTYVDARIGGYCGKLPSFALGMHYDIGSSGGGTPYDDRCPVYYGITTLSIRSASWVDGFRATCSYVDH